MAAADGCEWGHWTNALERFFLRKEKRRFEVRFAPHGDWPMADGSMSTPDTHAETYVRPGEENALRRAFQRCHNFIHGNEGMPKDAAFWQFLYLIFAKMHDERTNRGKERKFFAAADEPFSDEGRMKIRARINDLFKATKKRYTFFRDSDEITLPDRALSYMVMELARYNFSRSDVDAKGAAYQEIVGANLRGDRGQYFTPRCAVNLVVRILSPKENERVFDPADGTGGVLVATLAHRQRQLRAEYKRDVSDATQEGLLERLAAIQSSGPAAILRALADAPDSSPWDFPPNWAWITDKHLRCLPQDLIERAMPNISSHADTRPWRGLAHKIQGAVKTLKRSAQLAELEHSPPPLTNCDLRATRAGL